MKYLVTGGAGFIGSNFMYYMTEKYPEDTFVCIDALTYAGNYNNIKPLENRNNFKFVHGDIRDSELIDKLFEEEKFDYVVNREPLLERDEQIIDNSFLMLLKVLKAAGVKKVSCAGLDGYSDREGNYFDPKMEYSFVKAESARMNRHIKNVVAQMRKDMKIEFVTYSHYEENED